MKKIFSYISIITVLAINLTMIPSASAVGAAPARAILRAAPGDTVKGTVQVFNTAEEGEAFIAHGEVGDFIVDENEELKMMDRHDPENPQSLMNWMKMTVNDIKTGPKQYATLEYTIAVPKDAESKSYYGTVFVTGKPIAQDSEDNGNMSIKTGVMHLVLLEVTGNLNSSLELKEFGLIQDEQNPCFQTVFYNKGNTHKAPKAVLYMMDENNGYLDDYVLNPDQNNALPDRTKTFKTIWNPAEYEDGKYTVQLKGEGYIGEIKLEISNGKAVELENKITANPNAANDETKGPWLARAALRFSLIIATIAIFAVIIAAITVKIHRHRKRKKTAHKARLQENLKTKAHKATKPKNPAKKTKKVTRKKHLIILLILAFGLFAPHIQQTNAQDDTDFTGLMEVDEGAIASLALVGCWADAGGDSWGWNDTDGTTALLQPSDRENGAGGDPYGFYDTVGGTPYGDLAPINNNAFGYNDCRFQLTATGWSSWDVTLHGESFLHTNTVSYIPDMNNYGNAGFDFILDNEDPDPTGSPNDEYSVIDSEHGFFITATSNIALDPALDDGTSAGVTYNTAKYYDDTNCTAGNDRPCYHYIPDLAGNAHSIFNNMTSDLTNETFDLRIAAGATFEHIAGDYSMDLTLTLIPTP